MHKAVTSLRLLIGFVLGVVGGIALALCMISSSSCRFFLMPILQSFRTIPAAAIVPFFLLWFGFSEWGRYLLVVFAIAFNIAIAALQILQETPPNHAALFHSFQLTPGKLIWQYALPRIIESILPTIRFSLALAIGAVTVSELLGSQVGLGYLIQTSRATFSLQVLFLSAILLGVLSALADGLLVLIWRRLTFWVSSAETKDLTPVGVTCFSPCLIFSEFNLRLWAASGLTQNIDQPAQREFSKILNALEREKAFEFYEIFTEIRDQASALFGQIFRKANVERGVRYEIIEAESAEQLFDQSYMVRNTLRLFLYGAPLTSYLERKRQHYIPFKVSLGRAKESFQTVVAIKGKAAARKAIGAAIGSYPNSYDPARDQSSRELDALLHMAALRLRGFAVKRSHAYCCWA